MKDLATSPPPPPPPIITTFSCLSPSVCTHSVLLLPKGPHMLCPPLPLLFLLITHVPKSHLPLSSSPTLLCCIACLPTFPFCVCIIIIIDIQKGECSLKGFLSVVGESIDGQEIRKFKEGLDSKVKLLLYRTFCNGSTI